MNSRILSHLLFSFLFLSTASLHGDPSIPESWKTVRHPELIIFFPTDWEIEVTPDTHEIEATSPLSGPDDTYQESLLLRVPKVDEEVSLQDFTDELVQTLIRESDDCEILKRGPAQIGNNPGLKLEAAISREGEQQFSEFFLIKLENRVYIAECQSNDEDFGGLEPVLDAILQGFYPFPVILKKAYFHDHFLIQIPADWMVKEGMPGTHVAIISPKKNGKDPFQDRVSVGSEPLQEGTTFDAYVDKNFKILLTRLPGARKLHSGPRVVGHAEGRELELFHRGGGQKTFLRIIMVPKSGRVFTLFCSGMNPDYQELRATFDDILNSFASPTPPTTLAHNP